MTQNDDTDGADERALQRRITDQWSQEVHRLRADNAQLRRDLTQAGVLATQQHALIQALQGALTRKEGMTG